MDPQRHMSQLHTRCSSLACRPGNRGTPLGAAHSMRPLKVMLEHRLDEAFLRNPRPSLPELGSEALVQLAGRIRLLRQVRADDHAPAKLAAVEHVARGRRGAHLLKRHDDLAQAGRLRLARRRRARDEHLLHRAELRAQDAGLKTEPFPMN